MNIRNLLQRLVLLEPKLYRYLNLSWIDPFAEIVPSTRDEIEYEFICDLLRVDRIESINKKAEFVFDSISPDNFALLEIKEQLKSVFHDYWMSRTEVEELRDSILKIEYHHLQYKDIRLFNKYEEIENARFQFGDKLKCETILKYKNIFLERKTSITKREDLREIVFPRWNDIEAKLVFENRSEDEIASDNFGYVTLNDYGECIYEGHVQAIDIIQKPIKEAFIQSLNLFVLSKIEAITYSKFSINLENQIYDFIDKYIEEKYQKQINSKIDPIAHRYLLWSNEVMYEIKKEYGAREDETDYDHLYFLSDNYSNDSDQYEKYNGYNGFTDDDIDDAFEGDPANTWNID